MPVLAKSRPQAVLRLLAAQAAELCARLEKMTAAGDAELRAAQEAMADELGREVSPREFADSLAQSIVCGLPAVQMHRRALAPAADWLLAQATAWQRLALAELWAATGIRDRPTRYLGGLAAAPSYAPTWVDDVWCLYEPFLRIYARGERRQKGVFYTPQAIVTYMIREIDRSLRNEFGLDAGLATIAARPLRILDPAVGTGVFLVEIIRAIHRTWTTQGSGDSWEDYVAVQLLPRLQGIEILPAPCLIAQLHIAAVLAETGFRFVQPGTINVRLGDALAEPATSSHDQSGSPSLCVVLGNPPFSSLSDNRQEWIEQLVRGNAATPGYQHFAGQKLEERKTWLHDDYVKFIRLAQWHVEQAGEGIVGFVTNHGYLDNTTFRLMRAHLQQVFSRIRLVDLHGNRKKGETTPCGGRDENVFGLDQGVAIGLFRRLANAGAASIERIDLWGTRADKLARLSRPEDIGLAACPLQPAAPHYRFEPTAEAPFDREYEHGISLAQAMPVATTAPVTARDSFVVAFTRDELQQRIADFCDLSIPDDVIRQRYFNRTRSAKYASGDTRGWKLAAARRTLAAEQSRERFIRRCQYRPGDYRYIFWHPALIDWPRTAVTRHLLSEPERADNPGPTPHARSNLALIARRQMLPTQPCTFFWITDTLALDGIIRSDNLGSESLFPLYLYEDFTSPTIPVQANFSPEFIKQLTARLGWEWLKRSSGDLQQNFGPGDVLQYIYALFHSPTYRQRYAHLLRRDFPRILLPRAGKTFRELALLGKRLVDLHLLRTEPPSPVTEDEVATARAFRVGGYEVCRKWLQPAHRTCESAEFMRLQAAMHATHACMCQIDRAIEQLGGWTAALLVD